VLVRILGNVFTEHCSETAVCLSAYCIATAVLFVLFRGLCIVTGLYATMRLYNKIVHATSRRRYPCYRPWRPLGLREVEAPTLLRQTAKRWRQGCQPYVPATLYPQVSFLRFLLLISVRGWVDPRAIVRSEGLRKFEKIHLIGRWSRDLPVCGIVPQPLRYRVHGLTPLFVNHWSTSLAVKWGWLNMPKCLC
jgi:hypothetical protein